MTQEQFYTWMNDPTTMDGQSVIMLRDLTARYPYFSQAQMLLAKNLKQLNHIDQLEQMQRAALAVPDRKRLHDYIVGKWVPNVVSEPSEVEQPAMEQPLEVETVAEPILVEEQPEAVEHLLPNELIPEPVLYRIEYADLPELPIAEVEQPPLQEEVPAEMSFSEWLEFTDSHGKLPESDAISTQTELPSLSKMALIDRFLSTGEELPKKRAEFFSPQKAAARSSDHDFSMVSETLARIYAQQGNLELAAQAYKALCLKYPVKSVYFAARLKEIEDKQNTSN